MKTDSIMLNHKSFGNGEPVVLLHGYLESAEIWGSFAERLAENFRIFLVDLPGHGLSAPVPDQDIEKMADAVAQLMEKENVERIHLIGHSMGGYVSLAFYDLFPEKVKTLCLLHSHPFADSPIALEKRTREIELVSQGKKDLIAQSNIPNAFATDNLESLKADVERAKKIAKATSDDGIIACLESMKGRKDRSELWANCQVPAFLVSGAKDKYISAEVLQKIKMPQKGLRLHLLESGHQGFIEEEAVLVAKLKLFLEGKLQK